MKCDLAVSTITCSNCREDEVECIAVESRRSRKYRRQKRGIDQTPLSSYPLPSAAGADTFSAEENSIYPDLDRYTSPGYLSQLRIFPELPTYLRPIRPGFNAENAAFLVSCGALTVPEVAVRDELIRAYVLYVHPFMPFLDLQDFFQSIHEAENSAPCSLVLLQAVLFAGSAFADMSVLERMGFQTRRAARKALYIRTKVGICRPLMFRRLQSDSCQHLYEFDWEAQPIPVIQALLLISHWFESPDDQKDPFYWLGVCRILANRIGLGNSRKCLMNPPKSRKFLRRLWWMCVFRDRIIAMATRKPLQFREDEIHLPSLTLDDFDTEPINAGVHLLGDFGILTDPGIRLTLARLCLEKFKLALWTARIFDLNYSPLSTSDVPTTSVMLYCPNRPAIHLAENIDLHRILAEWQRALPIDCVFTMSPATTSQQSTDNELLFLHRAVLHMFSLMAFGLLYRPLFSAKATTTQEIHFIEHDVKPGVAKVAHETARMAQLLCEQDLVRKVPSFSTSFFISALPTFLLDMQHSTEALHWCREAVSQQRDIWPTADHASTIIEAMISRTNSEMDHLLPNRGAGVDTSLLGQEKPVLSATDPSRLNLGSSWQGDVAPGAEFQDESAWLDLEALFSQYCDYTEPYQLLN